MTTPSEQKRSARTGALTARVLTTRQDHADWNAFVASCPEGDALQVWEWAKVKAPDWVPLRIAVFRAGAIVGGCALLRRRLGPGLHWLYGSRGPLMADWNDEEVFRRLLREIRRHARGAAFLRIDPAVLIERGDILDMLGRNGFAASSESDAQGFGGMQPRCVMTLSLKGRDEGELLAAFKGQTRRNIKLAVEKHGVTVDDDPGPEGLAIFHALYETTARRDGFKPYSLRYLQNLWNTLAPQGMARLFLASYGGEVLSGAICFMIGKRFWYVFGASSNEHRNVMPNYAMQWAMIRWAKGHGFEIYDFRGVSPRRRLEGERAAAVEEEDHLQGLNRFKEGFGTDYEEYIGEYDLILSPAKRWAIAKGKPLLRRILRR